MTPNVLSPRFEQRRDVPGFSGVGRAKVGLDAGAEHLGASVWEVPPGQAAYPYHYHLAEEEMIVVLSGRPSLRHPGGWRELAEGDVVAFPVGEDGAHQIANFSGALARVLIISEMRAPEVNLQPDSGKLGAFLDPPGTPDGRSQWFKPGSAVSYDGGEAPPAAAE